ncbi:HAMP domain-containing protein [Pseudomonas aeruginosa]|nr:HAMP domain-containing protein [Pseudomonas aeruginosa]
MSMPLPMKLRTRLFLSISALITVSLFGLLLGLFSVMQLGRAQEQRMSHHYATIEVSQQLRQLLGDQLVILLRETPDGQALERSQNDFRRVLEQGRANTVDSAEQAALDGVRDAYLQLQAHTPALLEAPMADNDGFSEAFNGLRLRLQDLQQLALAGISEAETSARHRAYLVAGLLGLVGVAILLIGFVTAHSIARRFGAPIETLARAADRIGEGDFDVTLPMTNVAEVGQLTRRFGLMAEALRQYRKTSVEEVLSGERRLQAVLDSIDDGLVIFDNQGRIEHANPVAIRQLFVSNDPHGKRIDELLSDVDVQEAVEKALLGEVQDEAMPDLVVEGAGESRLLAWSLYPVTHPGGHSVGAVLVVRDVTEPRAFERVRSEFVLRASHELRTPVTGMQMAFSLLRERLDFPAESREADLIQTVDEEMSRLVLLINALLNFSRYQTGMQKLELASCDLVDLLTQAQQRFIPKGEARRVSLQLELGDELPRLQLDRLQIERVIDNLLENALRHSSEGGQIHLQARRQGDRVLIAVEDNGEGIPFSQQGRIFEPFVQVGRKKGGAGLGLARCKEIIQLHGGRIAVRSQPGQGARFYMLLPV